MESSSLIKLIWRLHF